MIWLIQPSIILGRIKLHYYKDTKLHHHNWLKTIQQPFKPVDRPVRRLDFQLIDDWHCQTQNICFLKYLIWSSWHPYSMYASCWLSSVYHSVIITFLSALYACVNVSWPPVLTLTSKRRKYSNQISCVLRFPVHSCCIVRNQMQGFWTLNFNHHWGKENNCLCPLRTKRQWMI